MSDFELPKDAVKAKSKQTSVSDLSQKKDSSPDQVEATDKKEEPKWDQNELLSIFDEIIFSGGYSEMMDIRGRLKIKFRTRTAEEVESITSIIDSLNSNLISTVNEKRALLNIHYALTMYQGKDLSTLKHEDRVKFIDKLPAPVIGMVINALFKFDSKISAACNEGEENF